MHVGTYKARAGRSYNIRFSVRWESVWSRVKIGGGGDQR